MSGHQVRVGKYREASALLARAAEGGAFADLEQQFDADVGAANSLMATARERAVEILGGHFPVDVSFLQEVHVFSSEPRGRARISFNVGGW